MSYVCVYIYIYISHGACHAWEAMSHANVYIYIYISHGACHAWEAMKASNDAWRGVHPRMRSLTHPSYTLPVGRLLPPSNRGGR